MVLASNNGRKAITLWTNKGKQAVFNKASESAALQNMHLLFICRHITHISTSCLGIKYVVLEQTSYNVKVTPKYSYNEKDGFPRT
jgi:hypothetical protein